MKRVLAAVTAALLIAACVAPASPQVSLPARCPVGTSQMGCSVPISHRLATIPRVVSPGEEIVPDVSNNNGCHIDWAAVKAWQKLHGWRLTGGVVKIGETVLDSCALSNVAQLHRLGMVPVGYVFVRPWTTASTVIGWARFTRVHLVVLDEEVPGIEGVAARVTPALRRAGFAVADYHAAGNVLDHSAQGLPCWTADLGVSHPFCSTGPIVGWQFSWTGRIPGIPGAVDMSYSYGLLKLGQAPHKAQPAKCWGKHSHPRSARCRAIRATYGRDLGNARRWQARATHLRAAHS